MTYIKAASAVLLFTPRHQLCTYLSFLSVLFIFIFERKLLHPVIHTAFSAFYRILYLKSSSYQNYCGTLLQEVNQHHACAHHQQIFYAPATIIVVKEHRNSIHRILLQYQCFYEATCKNSDRKNNEIQCMNFFQSQLISSRRNLQTHPKSQRGIFHHYFRNSQLKIRSNWHEKCSYCGIFHFIVYVLEYEVHVNSTYLIWAVSELPRIILKHFCELDIFRLRTIS